MLEREAIICPEGWRGDDRVHKGCDVRVGKYGEVVRDGSENLLKRDGRQLRARPL